MADLREKVIKGFMCCDGTAIYLGHCQEDCPYLSESERADQCVEKLHSDALSLLKAQEPEKPIYKQIVNEYEKYTEYVNKSFCPKCGAEFVNRVNYCPHCGKAVKWE